METLRVLCGAGIDGTPQCHVAQYSYLTLDQLRARLSQYPKGTTFTWPPPPEDPDFSALAADLARLLESQGKHLVFKDVQ